MSPPPNPVVSVVFQNETEGPYYDDVPSVFWYKLFACRLNVDGSLWVYHFRFRGGRNKWKVFLPGPWGS